MSCRVALVLERNNAVELKPSIEEIFDAVRKVCEDVMAITESLPRLAMLGTVRQLRELEVGGRDTICQQQRGCFADEEAFYAVRQRGIDTPLRSVLTVFAVCLAGARATGATAA
jgi:hypothetical protein